MQCVGVGNASPVHPIPSLESKLTQCRGPTDRPSTNSKGGVAFSRFHPAQESRHRLLQTDVPTHDAKVPGFPGKAVDPGPSYVAAAAIADIAAFAAG